jgi:hypothetical protein
MQGNAQQDKGLATWLSNNWVTLYFRAAILLFVFAYGLAAGLFGWFPAQVIRDGIKAAKDWTVNAEQYARVSPSKHLRPMRHPGDGVSRHTPQHTQPGLTLLSGMWGEQLGVRLVSLDGELLHEWQMSFNSIWPDAEHLNIQPHDWDTNIHGLVAEPNGDLIFNFEHHGLVSINACSEENWKIPTEAHHVVFKAYDGNLWFADSTRIQSKDPRFHWMKAPYFEEIISVISTDGQLLREISLLEVLYNSGWENLLIETTTGPGKDGIFKGTVTTTREDITHLNDIDVLSPELADAFELFEAGDIMLSLRNLDLILVVDGKTELIKWAMTGPWLMQHDPDFLESGNIMIFDNRARINHKLGTHGSRILEVDPVTRDVAVVYQGSAEEIFFTSQMGKQEHLENGNILIAEPDGGRAFEVTRDGETVWEYINRWSEKKVAVITDAQRMPEDYFDLPFNCE